MSAAGQRRTLHPASIGLPLLAILMPQITARSAMAATSAMPPPASVERGQLSTALGKIVTRQVDVRTVSGACYAYFLSKNFMVLPAHCAEGAPGAMRWRPLPEPGRDPFPWVPANIVYTDPPSDIAFAVSRVHPSFRGWLFRRYRGVCEDDERLFFLPRNSGRRLQPTTCLGHIEETSLIYLDGEARKGDSGAPVFAGDGTYLGMLIAKAPAQRVEGFSGLGYGVSTGTYMVAADEIYRHYTRTAPQLRELISVERSVTESIAIETYERELHDKRLSRKSEKMRQRRQRALWLPIAFGATGLVSGAGLFGLAMLTYPRSSSSGAKDQLACFGGGCAAGSLFSLLAVGGGLLMNIQEFEEDPSELNPVD